MSEDEDAQLREESAEQFEYLFGIPYHCKWQYPVDSAEFYRAMMLPMLDIHQEVMAIDGSHLPLLPPSDSAAFYLPNIVGSSGTPEEFSNNTIGVREEVEIKTKRKRRSKKRITGGDEVASTPTSHGLISKLPIFECTTFFTWLLTVLLTNSQG